MLNAHCTCQKATLYFSPVLAPKVESLVTDIVTDVLIRFPIIAKHSKGVHYFHRVVGLVVINIRQWLRDDTCQHYCAVERVLVIGFCGHPHYCKCNCVESVYSAV